MFTSVYGVRVSTGAEALVAKPLALVLVLQRREVAGVGDEDASLSAGEAHAPGTGGSVVSLSTPPLLLALCPLTPLAPYIVPRCTAAAAARTDATRPGVPAVGAFVGELAGEASARTRDHPVLAAAARFVTPAVCEPAYGAPPSSSRRPALANSLSCLREAITASGSRAGWVRGGVRVSGAMAYGRACDITVHKGRATSLWQWLAVAGAVGARWGHSGGFHPRPRSHWLVPRAIVRRRPARQRRASPR